MPFRRLKLTSRELLGLLLNLPLVFLLELLIEFFLELTFELLLKLRLKPFMRRLRPRETRFPYFLFHFRRRSALNLLLC